LNTDSRAPIKTAYTIAHDDSRAEGTNYIEGQLITCYGCNEAGHQYGECPHRRPAAPRQESSQLDSWAQVVVKGPRISRQDEELHKGGEGRGGPFDADRNTDTNTPVGDGQQQSRKTPTQPTTHMVSKDTARKRDKDTYVSTETVDMESVGHIVPGEEGETTSG
jgi:hypothetical protein